MTPLSNTPSTSLGAPTRALSFLTAPDRAALARALRLSPREATIAELALGDLHEDHIAAALGISRHTVHTHLDRIYKKTGAHSRCQLAILVFQTYVVSSSSSSKRSSRCTTVRRPPSS
jgi:DNA-binding CsgD family transcriptional regulator